MKHLIIITITLIALITRIALSESDPAMEMDTCHTDACMLDLCVNDGGSIDECNDF